MDYILILLGLFITLLAQIYIKIKYAKYKSVKTDTGMTGFDVARKILDANGLEDVYITEVKGELTDHYDPRRKVVRLSTDNFHNSTIASNSVAAHEVGHAIQHKEGYVFIKIRGFLVPFVNLSSKLGYFVIIIGFAMGLMSLALFGIALLLVILLFQLVTLPTEFNASKRAREKLEELNILNDEELSGAKSMLFAAALTYVASLATTVLEVLRLFLRVTSSDN